MIATEILKKYFGYDYFRDGQAQIINDILSYQDCLGIMPTGSGKSICFQVPALMMDGITIVISPLISLMQDQVNSLVQSGISAAFINSSLTENQIAKVLENAKNYMYKLIYIAPERLLTYEFLEFAKIINISMITIDEAHCISQWGQDFRPSYSKIPEFIEQLPSRPIISAFTATATLKVREDIINLLNLKEPKILLTGINRENLYFSVEKPKNKFNALINFLKDKENKNGIIYCSTRKTVEEVNEKLNKYNYKSSCYHAGLSDKERYKNQDDFLYDRVNIMVATNAFGMGIDKSDVSFVVHYNMPKDIESYYQEAGRAGRDGEDAQCVLFYSGKDYHTNLWLIENARDYEYPQKETEELLKELNRNRLKKITAYCTTTECLRSFILKYFGEKPNTIQCGNCSNCNSNYKDLDITIDAQKILSCVVRLKERFGKNMIADVLLGNKNEKIFNFGFDKLSTYGICDKSKKELIQIIEYLIINGYLIQTEETYPIIKLGPLASEVLKNKKYLLMKIKEIDISRENTSGYNEKSILNKNAVIRPIDKSLYEHLSNIRLEIATRQNVPSYVIFTNSTLVDMCMKLPTTPIELLKVSGVGQKKLEKYGTIFLEEIIKHLKLNPNNNDILIDNNEFLEINKEDIELSEEPIIISAFVDKINSVIIQSGYKKTTASKVNKWLISEGYLEIKVAGTRNYKIPTSKGNELGIKSEIRIIKGIEAKVNYYSKISQKFIAENIMEILNFSIK